LKENLLSLSQAPLSANELEKIERILSAKTA